MTRVAYNYKRTAITCAKELRYGKAVIEKLQKAETEVEIERIMVAARKSK